jgi:hypothetical protein
MWLESAGSTVMKRTRTAETVISPVEDRPGTRRSAVAPDVVYGSGQQGAVVAGTTTRSERSPALSTARTENE